MGISWLNNLRTAAVAAALVCAASVASATTINFNVDQRFTRGVNTYDSTDGSVTVDVDGVRVVSDGTLNRTHQLWTGSWDNGGVNDGLSVYTCTWRNLCIDDPSIDGAGFNEMALLNFGDLIVQITSVTFSLWDSNDSFSVGVYDSTDLGTTPTDYETGLGAGTTVTDGLYTHVFGPGDLVGSIIGFGTESNTSNILLNSITFDIIAAVPLPAGGLLILTALGGLVLLRRRQQTVPVAA